MKLEIPSYDRMSMSGSSILRALQSGGMPNIDLLVRESIQNSLDAFIPNSKYRNVFVNFQVDKFDNYEFSSYLEEFGKHLLKKKNNEEYDYISIEDSHTVGLNGDIDKPDIDGRFGNFQKLVYEIAKPQTGEGAGGSWGYGKTVYFRCGIGLVLFYSRFIDENGNERERLAGTYIEDEIDKNNSILHKIRPNENRGIAWFGSSDAAEDKTVPIENGYEIENILSCFDGLSRFNEGETGTKIIIPYINKMELLDGMNRSIIGEDDYPYYFWKDSFEETLANSIKLWYTPRIQNRFYFDYFKRPFLVPFINHSQVKIDEDNDKFYYTIQKLYSYALKSCFEETGDKTINDDYLQSEVFVKKVNYSKIVNNCAGYVAFTKVKIDHFVAGYNPYIYLGKRNESNGGNRPIISFTRMPGMVVNYQLSGEWANLIPSTLEDEYLIGMFVLNSLGKLDKNNLKLEDYIRSGELAKHDQWFDKEFKGEYFGRVASTISKNCQKVINSSYATDIEINDTRKIGISQKLGNIFLPSRGFGKKPSTGVKRPSNNPLVPSKSRGSAMRISNPYGFTSLWANVDFELILKNDNASIETVVATEGGNLNYHSWMDQVGTSYPFKISDLTINEVKMMKRKVDLIVIPVEVKGNVDIDNVNIQLLQNEEDNIIRFERKGNENYIIKGTFRVINNSDSRDFSYSFNLNKEDNSNE